MPQRTGASRSRNGCLTCKIRRVKCDEEKPTCRRCRSTGRKCDGYASPSSSTARQSTDLRVIQYSSQVSEPIKMSMFPSFHKPLAGCDYSALQFFHFQTVSCFGPRAGDFLLRAAYHDATVRVAATALGSLHRAFVRDGPAVPQSGLTRYAMQQYSSAIHLALNRIPVTEGQSSDSILIMCVLFFCFESLQGHFRNAVQHAIAGARILRQREERFLNEGTVARLPPSIVRLMFVTIENQMLEVDWRSYPYLPVSIQSTLLSPSKLPPVNLEDAPTLDQLSDSFQFCYNQYLKFLYLSQTSESVELVQTLQRNQAYYAQMRQHMHAWSAKFDAFLEAHVQADQSETDRMTISHLKMWRKMMDIFLKMESSPSQGGLDRFTSEFGAILSMAEDLMNFSSLTPPASKSKPSARVQPARQPQNTLPLILPKTESASTSPPASSSSFLVVSLGLVPLLWIIATSCRHSQIRHRAIDLMSRSRRREGVWDSVLFSSLARKMVEMEEEAAGFAKGAMYEPADLPVSARTNTVAGEFCEGRQGKIEFLRDGIKVWEETVQW